MTKKKKKNVPIPMLSAGIEAVDTHCHLDMDAYHLDLEEVIHRAIDSGVSTIVTIGIDLVSSHAAVQLALKYDHVYASVGIHPHNVAEVSEAQYEELIELAAQPKVVAYGEIGLDSVKKYVPEEIQEEHFSKQVKIAKSLHLPLIVHDREAHKTVIDILKAEAPFPAGGIMHCFSGDTTLARQVLELGFHISFPGVVTFNKAEMMQEVVVATSLDHVVLETDGPFLAPVPRRGKRNEPAYLLYTAKKIAELKGTTIDEVVSRTTANAKQLLRFL